MDDITPQPLSSLLQITYRFDGSIIAPASHDLNFMHWNINHLTNKLHLVEQYVAIYPGILHVIVISETWLTSQNFCTYRLHGYHDIHSVISTDGGSISIFVHKSICGITPKVLLDVVTPDRNQFLIVSLPSINNTIAVPYRNRRPDIRLDNINRFLN